MNNFFLKDPKVLALKMQNKILSLFIPINHIPIDIIKMINYKLNKENNKQIGSTLQLI